LLNKQHWNINVRKEIQTVANPSNGGLKPLEIAAHIKKKWTRYKMPPRIEKQSF
jgi:hypothetical protein